MAVRQSRLSKSSRFNADRLDNSKLGSQELPSGKDIASSVSIVNAKNQDQSKRPVSSA